MGRATTHDGAASGNSAGARMAAAVAPACRASADGRCRDAGEADRTFVTRLLDTAPELAAVLAVAKRLHRVLRRDASETLTDVLAAAEETSLVHFAAQLQLDAEVVQAALKLPWTTNSAEGQISRIKMLKRTMYGRAGFDLLRARFPRRMKAPLHAE